MLLHLRKAGSHNHRSLVGALRYLTFARDGAAAARCLFSAADRLDFADELPAVLLLSEGVDGVIKRGLEVIVHLLEPVDLCLLHQLGRDVVADRVEQQVLEQPGAPALFIDKVRTEVLKRLSWHGDDRGLDHARGKLVFGQKRKVGAYVVVDLQESFLVLRLGLECVLDDEVAKLVANQLFDVSDALGCQFAPLVTVGFLYAFLDNLAPVLVSSQLFEIEQDILVDLLLSLLGMQQGQDQFDNVVSSDIHHHFEGSVPLLECLDQ